MTKSQIPTLNKTEIIAAVSSKLNLSQATIGILVDSFLDEVTSALRNGATVKLSGFGVFRMHTLPERIFKGLNGNSGTLIPAHQVPRFKFSTIAKKQITQSK